MKTASTQFVTFLLVLVLACVMAVGCAKDGTKVPVSGAVDDFQVTFLFEKDGIKVYRFRDNGYYHYFTDHGETMYRRSNGKTTLEQRIP